MVSVLFRIRKQLHEPIVPLPSVFKLSPILCSLLRLNELLTFFHLRFLYVGCLTGSSNTQGTGLWDFSPGSVLLVTGEKVYFSYVLIIHYLSKCVLFFYLIVDFT